MTSASRPGSERPQIRGVRIEGRRLLLRAIAPAEIEAEWQDMVNADPMARAGPVDEHDFKTRLARSGALIDGWLDLAIDVDGVSIGRIQTFVPPGRELAGDAYWIGIGLRREVRGQGYGREAMALLTGWLFGVAGANLLEAPTDVANTAMRTVFDRIGWRHTRTYDDYGRTWAHYTITRRQWESLHAAG